MTAPVAGAEVKRDPTETQRAPAARCEPVEWHLRKVFTKLGIGSRRELRQALADFTSAVER